MTILHRLNIVFKAAQELGLQQLGLYGWYRAALWSGYLYRRTPPNPGFEDSLGSVSFNLESGNEFDFNPPLELPGKQALLSVLGDQGLAKLISEAQEILEGRVRLFGGEPAPLELRFSDALKHWTEYEKQSKLWRGMDPKLVWEPGRFTWACTLARAYYLLGDERYTRAFWTYTEGFLAANPANMGPNWVSAQEVALRLIAMAFALGVFASSEESTRQRRVVLAAAIADHAERIPATLAYARAQNNNHLLTEAVGLFTAGMCLPGHPQAERWVKLGWRWANRALQTQITSQGVYIQHSANYHRLMLQAATWLQALAASRGLALPEATRQKLAAAANWQYRLLDDESGAVPNLGHNDGAYILPLTTSPYYDYRPALAAADQAYSDARRLASGPWDEMTLWLSAGRSGAGLAGEPVRQKASESALSNGSPIVLSSRHSWGYLRTARFNSRPAHADQLHFDLWWRGLNVACDPGTYLYNAAPPWDNSLTGTQHHNTLMVDGVEQMTRAGRFLYLDWAQARVIERASAEDGSWERVVADHDGYRKRGVIHRRIVTAYQDNRWAIEDQLLPVGHAAQNGSSPHQARLHWLLPDWPWDLAEEGNTGLVCRLQSPRGEIDLHVVGEFKAHGGGKSLRVALVRGGELVYGEEPVQATRGWYSPTYGTKEPALSLSCRVEGRLPIKFTSLWSLGNDPQAGGV